MSSTNSLTYKITKIWIISPQHPTYCGIFSNKQLLKKSSSLEYSGALKDTHRLPHIVSLVLFSGFYSGYVLSAVLAGSKTVIRPSARLRETGGGRGVYKPYLGPGHFLCQWKNCLFSRCYHRQSISKNNAYRRNFTKY